MSWLEPLPDAEQQRDIDRWAIEQKGIPADDLMERAGAGLAEVAAQHLPAARIAVVCGKGNNGGDGLVAARHLRDAGRDVIVLLAGDAPAAPGTAPPAEPFAAGALEGVGGIVDCLLGTGFEGSPRAPLDGIIEAINASGIPVVAADMPSGVNGSTGQVEGAAVRAVATATFHAGKPGLWVHPGKAHSGEVHVIEIGIPPDPPVVPQAGLIGPDVLEGLPGRGAESTKFSSGNVVVIGGSPGLTGAPVLAAAAAQRAGAGYVTVACDTDMPHRPVEVMQRGMDGLDALLERADAVVLGPGLGRGADFVRELYGRIEVPVVLDADGLNAFEGHGFPDRKAPAVLTPHAGELARLIDGDVKAHRLACVRAAVEHTRAIVVLKGDDTLCADTLGRVAISAGGAPALATAGTGDVLSGVIAALIARGCDAERAACAGVYAHVRAGQIAARPHGPDSVIAGDVIAALPAALG